MSAANPCVRVRGDRVYVVYNPGYQLQSWGFAATATAELLEPRLELPWLLDAAKAAALLAARCAAAFTRDDRAWASGSGQLSSDASASSGGAVGDTASDAAQAAASRWLESELLYNGPTLADAVTPDAVLFEEEDSAGAEDSALAKDVSQRAFCVRILCVQ